MLRNYQNPRNFIRIRTLQSTPKGLPQETQRSTNPPESTSFRTFTGHRPNPLETFQKPSDGERIDLNSRRFLTSQSAKCDVLGPEARFPRELTCKMRWGFAKDDIFWHHSRLMGAGWCKINEGFAKAVVFLTPSSFNGRRVAQNTRRLCQRCRFFDTTLVYFTHRNYDEKTKHRKKTVAKNVAKVCSFVGPSESALIYA